MVARGKRSRTWREDEHLSERQPFAGLTEAEIDHIAEKAAKRALDSVYAEVGRNVLKKLAWLIGVVVISLALWLIGKDQLLK